MEMTYDPKLGQERDVHSQGTTRPTTDTTAVEPAGNLLTESEPSVTLLRGIEVTQNQCVALTLQF